MIHAFLAGLAVGLLSLVLWRNRATIQEILGQRLDLRWFGLGFLITQISLLVTFVRWWILVRVIEPRFPFRAAILLGFLGYVFNLVIPGAVGGDLVKAGYLARMQIRRTQAIGSMAIDRILGLVGLVVLAALAGIAAWGLGTPGVRRLIVAAWVGLGLGLLMLAAIFARVLPRLPIPGGGVGTGRLSTIIHELRAMSATYRRGPNVVLAGVGLSVISHGLNVLVFFLIGRMLFPSRMTTRLTQHLLIVPLIFLTMAVPLPLGALGLSEEVGDLLLKLVGHPSGALAMMGLRVLMIGCALEGLCVYLANLNEVRALTGASHRLAVDRGQGEPTVDLALLPARSASE